MDINAVMQAMSTLGFPIVACVALYYLVTNTIAKVTEALNDINKTLIIVTERLDKLEDGKNGDR